jgi:hypothetical protein
VWDSGTAQPPAPAPLPGSADASPARSAADPIRFDKYRHFAARHSDPAPPPPTTSTSANRHATDANYALTKTTNHDYFVAHRAFFFDLSVWADEAPCDDPHQRLGTDRSTLLAVMRAAYNGTHPPGAAHASGRAANGTTHRGNASGQQRLIHIGGFTPWWFKYVKEGGSPCCRKGAVCRHGGVQTEWETMRVSASPAAGPRNRFAVTVTGFGPGRRSPLGVPPP